MAETVYVDPVETDPPEDRFDVQVWIRTSEGAILWGVTFERGPFDTLGSLRAELEASWPWHVVVAPITHQLVFVQQQLPL